MKRIKQKIAFVVSVLLAGAGFLGAYSALGYSDIGMLDGAKFWIIWLGCIAMMIFFGKFANEIAGRWEDENQTGGYIQGGQAGAGKTGDVA